MGLRESIEQRDHLAIVLAVAELAAYFLLFLVLYAVVIALPWILVGGI